MTSEAAADQGHGPRPEPALQLNLDFETARSRKDKITALMQQMADIKMELASEYKAFEDEGGNRQMLKFVIRLERQDKSKTRSDLRALGQMMPWFLPDIDKEDEE